MDHVGPVCLFLDLLGDFLTINSLSESKDVGVFIADRVLVDWLDNISCDFEFPHSPWGLGKIVEESLDAVTVELAGKGCGSGKERLGRAHREPPHRLTEGSPTKPSPRARGGN